MILSRTMRPSDYQELKPELEELNRVMALCGPVPYTHRRWEYALALRAIKTIFPGNDRLVVSDFGCEAGLSPAMMLMQGYDVVLYEIWAWGNKQADAEDKAKKAQFASKIPGNVFRFVNRPLGGLLDEDKNRYDVSLCISVMEHIQDETAAWNDLLDSVKSGGLFFVTMDFHPADRDTFKYKDIRARIYNQSKMEKLAEYASYRGFKILGEEVDWSWAPDRIMVENQYGFGSLVMVKNG